jgi:uncharacterized protein (UPF0254 family)
MVSIQELLNALGSLNNLSTRIYRQEADLKQMASMLREVVRENLSVQARIAALEGRT